MKRKILTLLLAGTILGSTLYGCGSKQPAGENDISSESADNVTDSSSDITDPVTQDSDSMENTEPAQTDVGEPETHYIITGDIEYDRAIALGITTEEELANADSEAYGKELITLTNRMVEKASPEVYESYKKLYGTLKINSSHFTRYDAMCLIYMTAEALGEDYSRINNWQTVWNAVNRTQSDMDNGLTWAFKYYGEIPADGFRDGENGERIDLEGFCYYFGLGKTSLLTGNRLFELNEDADTIGPDETMTYGDMVKAVVRLYDSVPNDDLSAFRTAYAIENGQEVWVYDCDDTELARIQKSGIVPADWADDYNKSVTFAEYSSLLSNAVELWNPDKKGEWDNIIRLSADSDETMTVEDVCLMLTYFYAACGTPDEWVDDWGNCEFSKLSYEEHDDFYKYLKFDYPLFPDWETIAYPGYQSNYASAILILPEMMSRVSGKYVLPYDSANKSLHLDEMATREIASCALLRVLEYARVELDPNWADYVNVREAGTYDKSVITDELLNKDSGLPEVTQAKFPAEWHGMGLTSHKQFVEEYLHFTEDPFSFFEQEGFNFSRIFVNFATFRYPDYPDDPYLVNENELKELDQMIARGVEHGVHIQITMNRYMDENGNHFKDDQDMFFPVSEDAWDLTIAYWEMLAKRYDGIPSKLLTFDLCNESEPYSEKEFEAGEKYLKVLVDAVRSADPDRVLLYSQANLPNTRWTEIIAKNGIGVGCHVYSPEGIAAWDYLAEQTNPYYEVNWPLPLFPAHKAEYGDEAIKLQGEVGGKTLSLHLQGYPQDDYQQGSVINVSADDKSLTKFTVSGTDPDTLYSVDIPDGTKEVTINVERGNAAFDSIILEKDSFKCNIIPSDFDFPREYIKPLDTPLLPLVIESDGSYHNTAGTVTDAEYIYERSVKPYKEIADSYGVGFTINEFDVYGSNVDFDISVVSGYADTVLKMAKEHDLSWCYSEIYNFVPKYVCIMYGDHAQWENATVETIEVTNLDGSKAEFKAIKETLDVLKKYAGR